MVLAMDPNANPFNPGAGTPPPELVGREPILVLVDTILERIKRGRAERSLLLVGLRGVGKTVLLREIRRRALTKSYVVETIEAQEEQTVAQLLAPAVAELIGKTTNQLGPVRDTLIRKGMVYSPAHGDIAFTVPLFDQLMKRTMSMPVTTKRARR